MVGTTVLEEVALVFVVYDAVVVEGDVMKEEETVTMVEKLW